MRKNGIKHEHNDIRILTLDDDRIMTLTLQSYFESSGYSVDTENDPYAAIERIRNGSYDILLLDFLMTPICGDAVVAAIRKFNTDLFIVLLTGHKSMAPPVRTIRELDIQGYYEKSDRFDQLELLVESCVKSIRQMRTIRAYRDDLERMNEQLKRNYTEMVMAVRSMVDARDIYTRGHSDRVALLSVRIAEAMGRDEDYMERVRIAGLFHDIGKIRIPDSILLKPGALDQDEIVEIRRHPSYAHEILLNTSMFSDIIPAVLSHHERYDGMGYPRGLARESIPEEARIIAVADAFDAMTSFRRYRDNMTLEGALEEIRRGRGRQFDPTIADVALALLQDFESIEKDPAWVYPEPEHRDDEGGV